MWVKGVNSFQPTLNVISYPYKIFSFKSFSENRNKVLNVHSIKVRTITISLGKKIFYNFVL